MIATLSESRVIAAITDLADADSILVPPPRILHLVSSREIAASCRRNCSPSLAPLAHGAPICKQTQR